MSLEEEKVKSLDERLGTSYSNVMDQEKIILNLDKEDFLIILNQPQVFGSLPHEIYDIEKDGSNFVIKSRLKKI